MDASLMRYLRYDISIIVATDKNGAIGIQNRIPWKIRTDLKRFKEMTFGHTVLMGRKTCESIIAYNKGPLKGRRNIVLSRDKDFNPRGFERLGSWFEFWIKFTEEEYGDVYVIGGAKVYETALRYAKHIYITRVCAIINDADTYFPEILETDWELVEAGSLNPSNEFDEYDFYYETLKRITNQS